MSPHYLDQIPLDFSNPAVRELRSLLSDNYFRSAEVRALVRGAGAAPALINWDQPMALVWDDVLSTLQKQGKLRGLLQNLIDGPDVALADRLRKLTAD
jgi:endonuclease G